MRLTLRQARLDHKLTQLELGEMIGMTKQAVSALERGINDARARNWRKLAAILRLPQEALERQTDPP